MSHTGGAMTADSKPSGATAGKVGVPMPMRWSGLTGVSETLTAMHTDPTMKEGTHEHTWTVTVFYPSEPFRDGRALKDGLRVFLDALPRSGVLGPDLWSGENIARAALILSNTVAVRVTRPEGYEAWAWVEP